jgi:hypothetical protein
MSVIDKVILSEVATTLFRTCSANYAERTAEDGSWKVIFVVASMDFPTFIFSTPYENGMCRYGQ